MNQKIYFVLGAVALLGIGVSFGAFFSRRQPQNNTVATTTPSSVSPTLATISLTPAESTAKTGSISGHLIYPSSGIPEGVGVCAQLVDDLSQLTCVKQTKDPSFETGVGYRIDLMPATYFVYAYYKDLKAYYDEFVTCGLKATCQSHAKIPVVVTAGSLQSNILPHDWYNDTPSPTAGPTSKPTIKPIITLTINPNIIKLIPSNTPTPTLTKIKIIPNLKIIQP